MLEGKFKYNSLNLTDGGEGCFGYRHTPETLLKLRELYLKNKHKPLRRKYGQPIEIQRAIVEEYSKEGSDCGKVGKKFGFSGGGIRKILLKNGIKIKSQSEVQKKLTQLEEQEVLDLYFDGISSKELGLKYKVSSCTILAIVKRNGGVKRGNPRIIDSDGKIYKSVKEAAFILNLSETTIRAILARKNKNGYILEFGLKYI